MQDLLDTLKQCVERLDRYRRPSQRVGESNTKAGLIEPYLAARFTAHLFKLSMHKRGQWISAFTSQSGAVDTETGSRRHCMLIALAFR